MKTSSNGSISFRSKQQKTKPNIDTYFPTTFPVLRTPTALCFARYAFDFSLYILPDDLISLFSPNPPPPLPPSSPPASPARRGSVVIPCGACVGVCECLFWHTYPDIEFRTQPSEQSHNHDDDDHHAPHFASARNLRFFWKAAEKKTNIKSSVCTRLEQRRGIRDGASRTRCLVWMFFLWGSSFAPGMCSVTRTAARGRAPN